MADAYELICGLRLAGWLLRVPTIHGLPGQSISPEELRTEWLGLKQLIKLGVLKCTDNVKGKRGKVNPPQPLPREGVTIGGGWSSK